MLLFQCLYFISKLETEHKNGVTIPLTDILTKDVTKKIKDGWFKSFTSMKSTDSDILEWQMNIMPKEGTK